MNKILETERLYLRKIQSDDFPALCSIFQNEAVMYAWEHTFTTEEVTAWIDECVMRYDRDGFSYWAVINKETDILIGVAGVFMEEAEGESYVGIGYIFNNAYWHQGYAYESADACVRYAFAVLGIREITAQIRPDNTSSIHIAEKLGMTVLRPFIRKYRRKDVPHLLYGMQAADFKPISPQLLLSGTSMQADIPPAVPFAFPGIKRVHCLFSTVASGNMSLWADPENIGKTVANRARFMSRAGFSEWAEVEQVHGDNLVRIDAGTGLSAAKVEKADGIYTFGKGIGLIIKTADCQPILFARKDGGAVAALHVGWRGNAMNFPGSAVYRLSELFSCPPSEMLAVRGPSLGPSASEFINFHSEWPPEFASWFDSQRRTVNLWLLTRSQLIEAGLLPEHVFSLDLCTHEMADMFFSYRRRDTGRQVGAIWIE